MHPITTTPFTQYKESDRLEEFALDLLESEFPKSKVIDLPLLSQRVERIFCFAYKLKLPAQKTCLLLARVYSFTPTLDMTLSQPHMITCLKTNKKLFEIALHWIDKHQGPLSEQIKHNILKYTRTRVLSSEATAMVFRWGFEGRWNTFRNGAAAGAQVLQEFSTAKAILKPDSKQAIKALFPNLEVSALIDAFYALLHLDPKTVSQPVFKLPPKDRLIARICHEDMAKIPLFFPPQSCPVLPGGVQQALILSFFADSTLKTKAFQPLFQLVKEGRLFQGERDQTAMYRLFSYTLSSPKCRYRLKWLRSWQNEYPAALREAEKGPMTIWNHFVIALRDKNFAKLKEYGVKSINEFHNPDDLIALFNKEIIEAKEAAAYAEVAWECYKRPEMGYYPWLGYACKLYAMAYREGYISHERFLPAVEAMFPELSCQEFLALLGAYAIHHPLPPPLIQRIKDQYESIHDFAPDDKEAIPFFAAFAQMRDAESFVSLCKTDNERAIFGTTLLHLALPVSPWNYDTLQAHWEAGHFERIYSQVIRCHETLQMVHIHFQELGTHHAPSFKEVGSFPEYALLSLRVECFYKLTELTDRAAQVPVSLISEVFKPHVRKAQERCGKTSYPLFIFLENRLETRPLITSPGALLKGDPLFLNDDQKIRIIGVLYAMATRGHLKPSPNDAERLKSLFISPRNMEELALLQMAESCFYNRGILPSG